MADQDPPIGPLQRLDPSEPDQAQEMGRLEPVDPEAEEGAASEAEAPAPTGTSSRAGDSLGLAIALAVLLSLSSIAAIGGLVAISSQTVASSPDSAITEPIATAAAGPTIRVVPPPEEEPEQTDPVAAGESAAAAAAAPPPPPPVVAPPPSPSEESGSAGGDGNGKGGGRGGIRRPGIEGAWCDATAGTACDVVKGGPKPAKSSAQVDATGYIHDDEDGLDDLDDGDDDGDDDSDDSSHSSSSDSRIPPGHMKNGKSKG